MSKDHFELKEATLDAISEKSLLHPNIPVDIALQEAENLYVWCLQDRKMLENAGLDWKLVDDLPVRTGACRWIQSQWLKEYRSLENAQKIWAEKSPAAYELRNELLHHFFHAFFKIPDLYSRTQKIAEGSGHADMIQDLSDLSALGNANKEPLMAINFDLSMLDTAAAKSEEMAKLLANANGEKLEDNKLRIMRDKAYLHMKEAVDEIRRCGQYVFWKNDQRKKGYTSKYNKIKKGSKPKTEQKKEDIE